MNFDIEMELLYFVGIIGLVGMGAGALAIGNNELANTIAAGLIGFIGGRAIGQSRLTSDTV